MLEFLQQWWGLIGIIVTAIGGGVGIVLSIRNEKQKATALKTKTADTKVSKEFDLYTRITGYIDKQMTDIRTDFKNTFDGNREIARAEKITEHLEQLAGCRIHTSELAVIEARVTRTEEVNSIVVQGVNILVKKALKEQLNGEVTAYQNAFDDYFILNKRNKA